ncbi:MAG: hypothetical protein NUW06_01845 [Candidatus Acetothermia bacterium]|nr:hypothetical protein [Candidatus Acetothermia bacterium]MDH7504686.1 3'-5' exonuclease [Candidatus Acetothermia bacterium]
MLRYFLDQGQDVVILSRRNGAPWYVNYAERGSGKPDDLQRFLEHLRSFLPEEDRGRVGISTAHKYKGGEKQAVIVLDAVERSYPLIHPNWVFLRVFGDSIETIEDEERRLFYVAVTRAKDSLALVTESLRESPYLDDIRKHMSLTSLSWDELPAVPSLDQPRLEIRVFGAYRVKDELRDHGYQWNGTEKYWYRTVPAEGFSFDALLRQPWARQVSKIEVYCEMRELLHRWPT